MTAFSFLDLPVTVALSSLLLSFVISIWSLASNAVKGARVTSLGLQK